MEKKEQINSAYLSVFSTPEGKVVLDDFRRRARSVRVDSGDPNPYSAIYRVATDDWLQYILNKLEKNGDKYDN